MNDEAVCCPRFEGEPWDGVRHIWKDKPFLAGTVPRFLHFPIPGFFERTVVRMMETAVKNGISSPQENAILLTFDPSPWKSELLLSVTETKAGLTIMNISGTF